MQIDLFVALLDEQQEAKSNLREFTQNLVKRGIAEAIEENDEAGALYILLETVVDEIAEYWGVAVDIRPLNDPYFMRINKNLVVNNKGEVFNASFDSYLVDAWTWTGERNIQCERTEITLAEKVGYIELKDELSLELVENIAAQIVEFAANEGSKEEVKPEPEPEPELANWGDVQQPLVINNLADKYKDNHVLIKNNLAIEAPLFIQSVVAQEAKKNII